MKFSTSIKLGVRLLRILFHSQTAAMSYITQEIPR